MSMMSVRTATPEPELFPLFRVRITGRGTASTVPDNDGAVDAEVYAEDADVFTTGQKIGAVTLLPNPAYEGRLTTWGSLDNWADHALQTWLESAQERYIGGSTPKWIRADLIEAISFAVNDAVDGRTPEVV